MDRVPPANRKAEYYFARAQMLDASGKSEDAITEMDRAIQASPKRPDLYWQAAVFLSRSGRGPEALRLLDRAEQVLPQDPQIPLVKATLLEREGKTGDAEHLLDQIQRRWPEGAAVWVARGIILAAHRHFEDARRVLETAVSLGARSPEAWFCLADSTLRSAPERIDDADSAVQRALMLAPDDQAIKALADEIANRKLDPKKAVKPSPAAKDPDPGRLFQIRPPQDW